MGDARALADAVKEARETGDYRNLSLPDRKAPDAATAISEFYGEPLARVLASTASDQWGLAEWRHTQATCSAYLYLTQRNPGNPSFFWLFVFIPAEPNFLKFAYVGSDAAG